MTRLRLIATAVFLIAAPGRGSEPAVLWQAPGSITVNDWIWGAGGEAQAPKPPFEFMNEDFNGTNPKIRVRDAKGDRWTVKFGGEIHGDLFASRLLNALGYLTQPSYYVASGTITGVHDLKRAKPFVDRDGSFRFARFKLRDHKTLAPVDGEEWSWNDNPFAGTPQLNGLKILMMLTSNWDAKDARDGFFERDKWNPSGYQQQTKNFARTAPGGRIEWGYRGKHDQDITSGISADDVRWLLTYLSPITDEELRAGLRASGAMDAEIEIYTRSIRERIAQLQRLAVVAAPATAGANQGYN